MFPGERRGVVRFLAYLNQAHMGSYEVALDSPVRPSDLTCEGTGRGVYSGARAREPYFRNIRLPAPRGNTARPDV